MNDKSDNERQLRSFLRDIENDAIDKSQWIGREEVKERLAFHQTQQRPTTIADTLLRKGFLDSSHVDTGWDYIELRKSVYGMLEAKTSAVIYKLGAATLKRDHASHVFHHVSKYIGPQAANLVDTALHGLPTPVLKYEFTCNVYRCAFDALEKGIDSAIKSLHETVAPPKQA